MDRLNFLWNFKTFPKEVLKKSTALQTWHWQSFAKICCRWYILYFLSVASRKSSHSIGLEIRFGDVLKQQKIHPSFNALSNLMVAVVMSSSVLGVNILSKQVIFHFFYTKNQFTKFWIPNRDINTNLQHLLFWHGHKINLSPLYFRRIMSSLMVLSFLHPGGSWSYIGCGTQSVHPGFSQTEKLRGLLSYSDIQIQQKCQVFNYLNI